MKKKNIKIAIVLLVFFIIIMAFCNNFVFGFDATEWNPGTMSGGDEFKNVGNTIIGALRVVGSFISVVVLIILGIKYMMGSVEEKAEYKKTLLPYVIGAIMIFGISNVTALIQSFAKMF